MSDVGDSGGAPDVSVDGGAGDVGFDDVPVDSGPDFAADEPDLYDANDLDPDDDTDDPDLYDWAADDPDDDPTADPDPAPPHGIPRPPEPPPDTPRPSFSMWGAPARPAGKPAGTPGRPGAGSQRRPATRKPPRAPQRRKAPAARRRAPARRKAKKRSTSIVDRVIQWAQGQAAAARKPWALVRPGPLAGFGVAQVSERRFRTWEEALQHGRAGGQPRRYEPGTVTIRYGDGFGIIDVWDDDVEATLETIARTPPGQQR